MRKILLIILFLAAAFCFAGCSFGSEDILSIEAITTQEVEEGIMVTISYVDDLEDPFTFLVPRGEDGKCLSDVFQEQDLENNTTVITFYFDDDFLQPYKVIVPNGVGITDFIESHDEEGNTHIRFRYTDSTESDEFVVSKGDTGENGLTVVRIDNEYSDDFTQVIFTLYFSRDVSHEIDSDYYYSDEFVPDFTKEITVDILQGIGIDDIQASYDSDTLEYQINVLLSDGELIPLTFARMNTIFTGQYRPSNSQGINGDYYFETIEMNMWLKNNNNWVKLYSLKNNDSNYIISFDLNATGDLSARLNFLSDVNYITVQEGKYVAISGSELPTPTRDGYTFNGWYLTDTPSVSSGRFTDLTPVYQDMTLYANWIKNED